METGTSLLTYWFQAFPRISRCLSVRCSPSSRLMVYFLLLMVSNFRVHALFGNFMIHDFFEAVGFSFLPRRPPPWGWFGLAFFFADPQGLPFFFADPLDITIPGSGRFGERGRGM